MHPERLQRARAAEQALRAVAGARLIHGFRWFPVARRWACALELLAPPGGAIPHRTRWFLVADEPDGAGALELHPAAVGGLPGTWPHQAWGGRKELGAPWTSGNICVRSTNAARQLLLDTEEPPAFPERAVWLVEAAHRWLDAAASDQLAPPGSELELPPVPVRTKTVVARSEDADRLADWLPFLGRSGAARVGVVHPDSLVAVLSFTAPDGRQEQTAAWGSAMRSIALQREEPAAWIALPRLPVSEPWHIPGTWGELREVLASQPGTWTLDDLLFQVDPVHDGRPHWLLIGAPVPAIVGEAPTRMTWFAARMPAFANPARPPEGFRRDSRSRRLYLREVALRDDLCIDWAPSQSWHPEAQEARGVHPELYPHAGLLIGGGAIGSTLSDLLVRGGLRRCLLYDPDTLGVGNLCRHTAFFTEVGIDKAHTLGVRLALSSPYGDVTYRAEAYPPDDPEALREATRCTLVIDATAEDRVLHALAEEERAQDTLFASVWIGYRGRRIYVFTARGRRFPLEAWRHAVAPWLVEERAQVQAGGLPREGLGCWSVVFPAHGEDIWQASTLATRLIIHALSCGPQGLVVYQQDRDPDGLPRTLRIRDPAELLPP